MTGLSARQVNLLLAVLVGACLMTGLSSWAVGTAAARYLTVAHAVSGLGLVVLAPAKLRRSVRSGMRRGRPTRWLSVGFGAMVTATVALGLLHASGLWYGVGYWSALWTHFLLAFALIPLLVWHMSSRPVRPRLADLDRRALLSGGAVLGAAGAVYVVQESAVHVSGLAGADRRFTGSHEIASFRPAEMPSVSWINDEAPDIPTADWPLSIWGESFDWTTLVGRTESLVAALDCTGGWFSEQSWDVVNLAELESASATRSVRITSATGFSRLYPYGELENIHLAIGYGGEPLRRRHGAPVRVVAPGRRGPWWIKWVERIELDDRPWWLQFPFPLS